MVASRQETDLVNHTSQRSGGIRSTREPKDADLVAWTVVLHEEAVASLDVFVEVPGDGLVHHLGAPLEERLDGARLEVGTNTGLVWRNALA